MSCNGLLALEQTIILHPRHVTAGIYLYIIIYDYLIISAYLDIKICIIMQWKQSGLCLASALL